MTREEALAEATRRIRAAEARPARTRPVPQLVDEARALSVACPRCGAPKGARCWIPARMARRAHQARRRVLRTS